VQGLWGTGDKARSFLSSGQFWPQKPEAATEIPIKLPVRRGKQGGAR